MAELFSQILGLSKLDVYSETENNDNSYFDITGLPRVLSYGKHPFAITFKDPENLPLLRNSSNVVFEFVDSRGTVIFSNLIDIDSLSGAGNGFIWIKKDPLRTANEIADGPAYFYIAGELGGDGIPNEWKGIYNLRSTFVYDIRKKYPNTSPIIFKTPNNIQINSNFSESIDFDTDDTVFKRSYVNVSASHMETNGGQVRFIELSYKESKSKSNEFKRISTYLVSGSEYEVSASVANGLNPVSHEYKVPTPKDFRRSTPTTFKLRFLNPSSEVAQHYTSSLANQDVEVTSSLLTFEGSPTIVEKEDNLLSGSMFTGNAVGKGFEQSGKSSAYLKTVDYKGFESASIGSGSAGVMFFSGSVLSGSGDAYDGVGLELHGGKGSGSFRFRSNPSLLEIKANTFFVGSENTQFISGSGGNVEISSSAFHLTPEGNVTASNILLGDKDSAQYLQFVNNELVVQGTFTANEIRTPATIGGTASTRANSSSSIDVDGFARFVSASIGGWTVDTGRIFDANDTIELNSETPGLNIKDAGGVERVSVKSGSFLTIGAGSQYIENQSFEDQTINAGRNFRSGSNILSWSFSLDGKVSASLTDRGAFDDRDKAVSGDVTLDVYVPSGEQNYSGQTNTYEISQTITSSFSQGETFSFSSVARFSSSFSGVGKDRALGPQYFRLEYSSSNSDGFKPFLPANNFTASNGYGEYFLGTGQYNSFGASADLPENSSFIKVVMTGSINDDTGFTVEKPLYVGDKGTIPTALKGKKFKKVVVGSTIAEYPETEITWDNFSLRANQRKVELTNEGLLIYNSEDSFIKMDASGIEFRGGSGVSTFGSAINRESFTNDGQVAGTLGAPAIQPYTSDPEDIGITAFDGNVGEFAKGNHRHAISSNIINSVVSGSTLNVASLVASGDVIAKNYIVSSSVTNIEISTLSGSSKFGDTQDDIHQFTGSLTLSSSVMTFDGNGIQIGTAGNNTDQPLRVNNRIMIHQDSGGAGDSELHFDRRHDGADARIKAVAGAGGAYATELHFVTTHASSGEQTVLQLDDNGHIYSDLANAKISGSSTSTGSFGVLGVGGDLGGSSILGGPKALVVTGESYFDGDVYIDSDDFLFTAGDANIYTNDVGANLDISARGGELTFGGVYATTKISGSAISTGSFGSGYIDNKLGIGTPNPTSLLHLSASSDYNLILENSGTTSAALLFKNADHNNRSSDIIFQDSGGQHGRLRYNHLGDKFEFIAASVTAVRHTLSETAASWSDSVLKISGSVFSTGSFGSLVVADRVGIGTITPTVDLEVNSAAATTVKINAGNGEDAILQLYADRGDNNSDKWDLTANAGNSNILEFNNAGSSMLTLTPTGVISGSSSSTGSFGQLKLIQDNSPSNPTLNFGDGDSGFYESADDVIRIAIAGGHAYGIDSAAIQGNASNRFAIRLDTPTSTVPNFTPNKADSNTGIGWSSADKLALIAGGLTGLEITGSHGNPIISGSSTSTGSFGSVVAAGTGVNSFTGNARFENKVTVGGNFNNNSGVFNIAPSSGTDPSMYFEQFTSSTDGTLGIIRFGNRAVDGELANIEAANDGATDSAYLAFSTEVTSGALTERLRIHSGGTVEFKGANQKISGSSTSTGSFGRLYVDSHTLINGKLGLNGAPIDADLNVKSSENNSNVFTLLDDNDNGLFNVRQSADAALVRIYDGGVETITFDADGGAAGGGLISGSLTSTGSFGHLQIDGQSFEPSDIEDDLSWNDGTATTISGSSSSTGSFGSVHVADKIGIGTTSPTYDLDILKSVSGGEITLRVMNSNTGANSSARLYLGAFGASGTGDPHIYFNDDVNDWALGVDKSDSSKFKLSDHSSIGTNDRLVIDTSGNVGIGQTNPANLLQVGDHVHVSSSGFVGIGLAAPEADLHISNASPAVRFTDENVSNLKHQIIAGGDAGLEYSADFNNQAAGYHRWDISNSEKMRLTEAGNLGIGTSAPTKTLTVAGEISSSGAITSAGLTAGRVLFAHTAGLIKDDADFTFDGDNLTVDGNIISTLANAKISGSATSTGSFGSLTVNNAAVGSARLHVTVNDAETYGALFDAVNSANNRISMNASAANRYNVIEFSTAGTFNHALGINDSDSAAAGVMFLGGDATGANAGIYISGSASAQRKVGIGTTSPEGLLHIKTSEASGEAPSANANNLVIEENGNAGLSIITGTGNQGSIYFGDDGNNAGRIIYDHSVNKMRFSAGTSGFIDVLSGGHISGSSTSTGSFGVLKLANYNQAYGTSELNTFFGINAGGATTISARNVAIGHNALAQEDVGDRSVAVGYFSLYTQNSDSNNEEAANTGVGYAAGYFNETGQNNTYIGFKSGFGTSGYSNSNNTAVGYNSLLVNRTGTENVAIGKDSMRDAITSDGTVAVGVESLYNVTSGDNNVGLGKQALYYVTTGANNVAVGLKALKDNTASNNVAVGTSALENNTTGEQNVAMGYEALLNATEIDQNTAIGFETLKAASGSAGALRGTALGFRALLSNTSGYANTAVGAQAGLVLTTGGHNTLLGMNAGDTISTASGSVYIGSGAGQANTTGNQNIAIGLDAMGGPTTTGDNNIAIGVSAGDALTSGYDNIFMGRDVGGAVTTGFLNTFIGAVAGDAHQDGYGNTALGYEALSTSTSVVYATALGAGAMGDGNATTGANHTTAVGLAALKNLTSGGGNVAMGAFAAVDITTGAFNTVIGYEALTNAQTAVSNNTAVGYRAGYKLGDDGGADHSENNVIIGQLAMGGGHDTVANNIANHNVAIGAQALGGATGTGTAITGTNNVAVGIGSMKAFSTGYNNVSIGKDAGDSITTGVFNTLVGTGADLSAANGENQIVIGYAAAGHGNNIAVIGNTSITAWHPADDDGVALGSASYRFSDVFAVQTTTGGIFETGLKTKSIGENPTGTIVSWKEDGLVPCDKNEDELVMGVIKQGKDEPIILGAEPVLVTGKVKVGDYIVTSDKIGHGKSVNRGYLLKKNLFGKVIAQALEKSDDSESCLIKCMIRKM